ncbi:hypothetical protein T05_5793 [Trichinella murrelli]|uniref:Uncharacterized protein n=1 Tax=Trichinella murrelli TaxID=144512 RepID=A0A0V0TGX1_9BILA|nr:hypothetical protein T05_5793 [Trichinella murrelli]
MGSKLTTVMAAFPHLDQRRIRTKAKRLFCPIRPADVHWPQGRRNNSSFKRHLKNISQWPNGPSHFDPLTLPSVDNLENFFPKIQLSCAKFEQCTTIRLPVRFMSIIASSNKQHKGENMRQCSLQLSVNKLPNRFSTTLTPLILILEIHTYIQANKQTREIRLSEEEEGKRFPFCSFLHLYNFDEILEN